MSGPGEHLLDERAREASKKFDGNKLPVDLLPPEPLMEIAAVLQHGAAKYGAYNWQGGMSWSRLYGALLRHVWAWWLGQDRDEETGLSHLAHAGCCVLFLLYYQRHGLGADDRPKGGSVANGNAAEPEKPPGAMYRRRGGKWVCK